MKFALAHGEDQGYEAQPFQRRADHIGILKEHEAGVGVADLCRKHGASDASIYKWKPSTAAPEAKRLKTLEMRTPV